MLVLRGMSEPAFKLRYQTGDDPEFQNKQTSHVVDILSYKADSMI
jgi:hypothetical protein